MEVTEATTDNRLKLYSYFRSSCSFRVRIALNLKGLKYDYHAVNLLKGEQHDPEFIKLNPIGYVPVLVDGDTALADSFAILMYLDSKFPQHPLLPENLYTRAINYQAANIVSSSIQPHQNIPVLKYLDKNVGPEEKLAWVQHHIGKGFAALEKLLNKHSGKYATGDEVFLVLFLQKNIHSLQSDIFLAPQIHAGVTRFSIDMSQFPILSRLYEAYKEMPAFRDAMPENQPDFPAKVTN